MKILVRILAVLALLIWAGFLFTIIIPILYWIITGDDYWELKDEIFYLARE
jgi:phage shock protein PspC (stress-responsive transcriptional regulator)